MKKKKRMKKSLVDQLAIKTHFSAAASLLKPEFRVKNRCVTNWNSIYIKSNYVDVLVEMLPVIFFFNVKKLCWLNQGKRIKIGVDNDRKSYKIKAVLFYKKGKWTENWNFKIYVGFFKIFPLWISFFLHTLG